MRYIGCLAILFMSFGCTGPRYPYPPYPGPERSATAKGRQAVPALQREQRTVIFTGQLISVGDETRNRMLTWVGTFRTADGISHKVIIGKSNHPFLEHIGLRTTEDFVSTKDFDFSHLPSFRITGRNPVGQWCTLESWKEVKE